MFCSWRKYTAWLSRSEKERDQHIGSGDLVAPGILHVQHGALNDALESRGGLGVLAVLDRQRREILVDIFGEPARKASRSTLQARIT